ncbi:MAG: metal-dependent hydrolase [Verrucomicrobia bacterium]|nr:metal-dependent hydrolase [Verrucomicrobiota bacterium]
MHLLTHTLAGWCAGNCVTQSPKVRAWCMGISLLPDIDGVSVVFGVQAFYDYHHTLAHNLLFAFISSVMIGFLNERPLRSAVIFFALIHLHFLMDFFGSGPIWGIPYLVPFFRREFVSGVAWEIDAWQNFVALALLGGWTMWIAIRYRRTPFEFVAPRLENAILRRKIPQKSSSQE